MLLRLDIRIEKKANYAWYLAVQSSASLKRTGNKNPSIVIHDSDTRVSIENFIAFYFSRGFREIYFSYSFQFFLIIVIPPPPLPFCACLHKVLKKRLHIKCKLKVSKLQFESKKRINLI